LTTEDVIEVLGGWEGYSIEEMEVQEEEGRTQVWIELTPLTGIARRCSGCGQLVHSIHDVTFRWVREVTILGAETWLWMGRVRVACPDCGPKLEALDWLAPLQPPGGWRRTWYGSAGCCRSSMWRSTSG